MRADDQAVTAALVLADRVVSRVQTHPVGTLAAAAGVGVVLARGIPDIVLRFGASAVLRLAAARMIDSVVTKASIPEGDDAADDSVDGPTVS